MSERQLKKLYVMKLHACRLKLLNMSKQGPAQLRALRRRSGKLKAFSATCKRRRSCLSESDRALWIFRGGWHKRRLITMCVPAYNLPGKADLVLASFEHLSSRCRIVCLSSA